MSPKLSWFLEFFNVFRRFMPNFARLAAPLNRKVQKNQPTKFSTLTAEKADAMRELQNLLISPPVLIIDNTEAYFMLDTDTWHIYLACVLLQDKSHKTTKRVRCCARFLAMPRPAYDTTQCEWPMIAWSVKILLIYLEGTQFTIRADHDSYKWILSPPDTINRLTRCRLRLSEFELDAVQSTGMAHQVYQRRSNNPAFMNSDRRLYNWRQ